MEINIEQTENTAIRITDLDSGCSKESHSVEANLMFAILHKLEEIRCCTIDVESALTQFPK